MSAQRHRRDEGFAPSKSTTKNDIYKIRKGCAGSYLSSFPGPRDFAFSAFGVDIPVAAPIGHKIHTFLGPPMDFAKFLIAETAHVVRQVSHDGTQAVQNSSRCRVS